MTVVGSGRARAVFYGPARNLGSFVPVTTTRTRGNRVRSVVSSQNVNFNEPGIWRVLVAVLVQVANDGEVRVSTEPLKLA